jgi:predicted 3-demethylubiquinone-9 3-methyltransferase (glyoxalase superfamily)
MPRLSPCLWFDRNAEEAANFYVSVFKNSKIGAVSHYGAEGEEIHGGKNGQVLTVEFHLDGNTFVALNGGPAFKFNEAISFQIDCNTQDEVDYYWERLSEGGPKEAQQCGWVKDKFGVSWQVVPVELKEMLTNKDPVKADKVMKAMLQMKKLDIAALRDAYAS